MSLLEEKWEKIHRHLKMLDYADKQEEAFLPSIISIIKTISFNATGWIFPKNSTSSVLTMDCLA